VRPFNYENELSVDLPAEIRDNEIIKNFLYTSAIYLWGRPLNYQYKKSIRSKDHKSEKSVEAHCSY